MNKLRTWIALYDDKRLVEELIPAHLTYSGLQSVLKMLLAERVRIGADIVVLQQSALV